MMKVADTKVVAAHFDSFGLLPDYAKYAMREGSGIYRGAHNLPSDFENYRLDAVSSVDPESGKVKFENQAKSGKVTGMRPVLCLPVDDWAYMPVVGDVVFAYLDDQDQWRPAVVQGHDKKKLIVAGRYDSENWTATLPSDCLICPVAAIIDAGLVTAAVAGRYFDGYDSEDLQVVGTALYTAKLSVNDLIDYRTASADDLPTTKLYKKIGKKAGLEAHHDVTKFLLTGELIELPKPKKAPRKAAPKAEVIDLEEAKAQRAGRGTTKPKQSKGAADAMAINEVLAAFDAMTGAALKKAYTAACDVAGVAAGDRKTRAVDAREHVAEFMTAEIARHLLGKELIQPKALDA